MAKREGCRDCKRCTESMPAGCMRTIGYLFILPALWEWWQAATGKRCPKCRHPLNWHQRRADGSFTD